MKTFVDKIVVITGAGSGIGRALALEFGRLGAKLALNDYAEESLQETVKLATDAGYKCLHSAAFDVSDEQAVFDFAATIKSKHGNASVVINNAGILGSAEPSLLTPTSAYKRVMDVNFFGVLYGCKAFMPQLIEENEGALVNISSVFGFLGSPSNSDYCASKFAVRGYTETLSIEFHKSPISIHSVHPGGINTNITSSRIGRNRDMEAANRVLSTPPAKLARRIIKGIRRKESQIVYGNLSRLSWLTSKLVPRRLQDSLIWNLYKKTLVMKDYEGIIR